MPHACRLPNDRNTVTRLSRDEWVESQLLSPLLIFARPHCINNYRAQQERARGLPEVGTGQCCIQHLWLRSITMQLDVDLRENTYLLIDLRFFPLIDVTS